MSIILLVTKNEAVKPRNKLNKTSIISRNGIHFLLFGIRFPVRISKRVVENGERIEQVRKRRFLFHKTWNIIPSIVGGWLWDLLLAQGFWQVLVVGIWRRIGGFENP